MVFNIEEGGTGVDLENVVEAIRLADPDIVAVQEGMGNAGRIATSLGWRYASDRTQILSPHPIADPPGGDRVAVLVEVRPGRVVAVASVHLPAEPYGPEAAKAGRDREAIIELERRVRLPKLRPVLAVFPRYIRSGIPVFLAGDFNAPSHLDWIPATVALRPQVREPIDWPVSLAVEAAGFRDTWREIHPDPVAEPGLTWWAARPPTGGYEPGPDTPDDRIDFIYAAGPSITTDSRIVGEAGATDVAISVDPWPSDHRAVVSTFRVWPASAVLAETAIAPHVRRDAGPPADPVRLATARPVFGVGEPIEVHWTGGPGFRWDWIAVFPAAATDLRGAHLIWEHTDARINGTIRLDAASAVVDQSSVGGRWPLPPGDYFAAYLLDDSPRELGRVAFRIGP